MNDSANVKAVAALDDLRSALFQFGEEATDALGAAEAEIRRIEEWVEERLKSWHHEVRLAEDAVFQAKTELARRKMMRFGDDVVDTTDQELALRKAKARLEYAEEQVQITRGWVRQWPKAVTDYRGPSGQLKSLLEGELPRACAFLSRKTAALEAYAQGAPMPTQSRGLGTQQQSDGLNHRA